VCLRKISDNILNTMTLFTGKGDNGTTTTFGCCDQRISKSSMITEALGSLDQVNSYLGFVKISAQKEDFSFKGLDIADVIGGIQQNLFIVQAEVAGAEKTIAKEKVDVMSDLVNDIEKELPPIKTFFVSGGKELSTLLDFSRTMARQAERRVVAVQEEGTVALSENSLAYLNRLSSLLYAFARLFNHLSGINEEAPKYE
jgi:cob(I)alamin adenosyltransferase